MDQVSVQQGRFLVRLLLACGWLVVFSRGIEELSCSFMSFLIRTLILQNQGSVPMTSFTLTTSVMSLSLNVTMGAVASTQKFWENRNIHSIILINICFCLCALIIKNPCFIPYRASIPSKVPGILYTLSKYLLN